MYNVKVLTGDKRYISAAFENNVQVGTGSKRMFSLYAFNNSGDRVYLYVLDSANGGGDGADANFAEVPYPIEANSYISIATQGGELFRLGIFLAGTTDAAGTTPAGSVLWFKAYYQAKS